MPGSASPMLGFCFTYRTLSDFKGGRDGAMGQGAIDTRVINVIGLAAVDVSPLGVFRALTKILNIHSFLLSSSSSIFIWKSSSQKP
jgi:hypothetical protein